MRGSPKEASSCAVITNNAKMSGTTEQDSTTPVLYEPDHAQLKAKINAFICANGDANVTQAAREVTRQVLAPPSMSISPSSAEVALAAFWAAYLSIVKSVPSANVEKLRRLADVVQAIRGIEDFALEPWGSDGSARPKLWSDLPFLGVEMRHEWSGECKCAAIRYLSRGS